MGIVSQMIDDSCASINDHLSSVIENMTEFSNYESVCDSTSAKPFIEKYMEDLSKNLPKNDDFYEAFADKLETIGAPPEIVERLKATPKLIEKKVEKAVKAELSKPK